MRTLKWIGWVAAAAMIVLTAGCHHDHPQTVLLHGEDFPGDNDSRSIWEIHSAQAAAGARQDATLYAVHFDEAGLNSLGQQKLDLMLSDEQPSQPLVVYLDLADGASTQKVHQSVADFLRSRGLADSQIALKDGPNPQTGSSAAGAVASLRAMEAGPAPQSGTPGGSTPVNQNATSAGNPQPTYTSH